MKHRDKIIAYFNSIPEGNVVSANDLYQKQFTKMTESAFFKALERLTKEQFLTRVSKGMYARNFMSQVSQSSQVGQSNPVSQSNQSPTDEAFSHEEHSEPKQQVIQNVHSESALNYFFGENNDNGMYIGYRLYAKYGITNIESDEIELYSNAIRKQTSNIGNVHVKRVNIELDYENTRIIEALEILQNYDKIEGLNKQKFAKYARQIARGYNDEVAISIINHMKYKKSTIAFLKKILEMYKVRNSLQQFLSSASTYKVPPVQRVAR